MGRTLGHQPNRGADRGPGSCELFCFVTECECAGCEWVGACLEWATPEVGSPWLKNRWLIHCLAIGRTPCVIRKRGFTLINRTYYTQYDLAAIYVSHFRAHFMDLPGIGQLSALPRLFLSWTRVPVLVVDYFVYRQSASRPGCGAECGAECGFGIVRIAKGEHHEQVEVMGVAENLARGLGPVEGDYAGAYAEIEGGKLHVRGGLACIEHDGVVGCGVGREYGDGKGGCRQVSGVVAQL